MTVKLHTIRGLAIGLCLPFLLARSLSGDSTPIAAATPE
jgi:hypothetical protein